MGNTYKRKICRTDAEEKQNDLHMPNCGPEAGQVGTVE